MNRPEIGGTRICLSPETIFENASDAVIAIDMQEHILWLNRAAEKMSGLSRAEVVKRPCAAVMRSSMCKQPCLVHESLKAGRPILDAAAFTTSGGRRIAVSVSLALVTDAGGRIIAGLETVRDLSQGYPQSRQESKEGPLLPLTSKSHSMQRVVDLLPGIASSPSAVLVYGETGTGKELTARTIHMLSPRRGGPFVAINCGAFPDTLLASELFGYKRGAFTDARKDKVGRLAIAKGGTLFLDDTEVMSPAMQNHLLRVLQERVYEPLGSSQSETMDARLIFATNEDLSEMVRKGEFRKDLYYRVKVARIDLPPLRQRKEDIPLLVEQMISSFNRSYHKSIDGIGQEVLGLLLAYDWPGNVRELEHALEHAFTQCGGHVIGIEHLPREVTGQEGSDCLSMGKPSDMRSVLHVLEAEAIGVALERNAFNRAATARELGIHKVTLFRKMKALGIRRCVQ